MSAPRQPPPEDWERVERRDGGGRGWMLATVGLVALAVGVGAGLLLGDDDGTTRTVSGAERTTTATVTAPGSATSLGVTVTQPTRTVTQEVTVTEPVTITATTPGQP
jgi:hypothetical protein